MVAEWYQRLSPFRASFSTHSWHRVCCQPRSFYRATYSVFLVGNSRLSVAVNHHTLGKAGRPCHESLFSRETKDIKTAATAGMKPYAAQRQSVSCSAATRGALVSECDEWMLGFFFSLSVSPDATTHPQSDTLHRSWRGDDVDIRERELRAERFTPKRVGTMNAAFSAEVISDGSAPRLWGQWPGLI